MSNCRLYADFMYEAYKCLQANKRSRFQKQTIVLENLFDLQNRILGLDFLTVYTLWNFRTMQARMASTQRRRPWQEIQFRDRFIRDIIPTFVGHWRILFEGRHSPVEMPTETDCDIKTSLGFSPSIYSILHAVPE